MNINQNTPKINLNSLKISKAKTSDFDEILKLLKQLWPKKLKLERLINKYKTEIKSKSKLYFLINLKKRTVGFYSLKIIKQKSVLYIDELVIDSSLRAKGIGTATMENIMFFAKRNGYKKIQLYSNFRRKKTHNFYQKLGFKKQISLISLFKRAFIFTKTI